MSQTALTNRAAAIVDAAVNGSAAKAGRTVAGTAAATPPRRRLLIPAAYALLIGLFACAMTTIGLAMYDASTLTADHSTLDAYRSAVRSLLDTGAGKVAAAGAFCIPAALSFLCLRRPRTIGAAMFRFRYVIAVGLVVLLVACNVSGSSLARWGLSLPPGNSTDGLLFGMPRSTRTDEWALFTPMALAQTLDPQGSFPYFGEVFRGTSTDMFVVYGQPVWDIAMIFRPFQWGYLLLGFERGLSFFWCARLVALFMCTFELGRMLTRDNRPMAVVMAALVTFAPVVQWWYAINGFVEMIVFSELIALCMRRFFMTSSVMKKMGCCIVLVISAGGFALTLYPAWEIPMAYLALALLVGVMVDARHQLHVEAKKDVPIIAGGIVLLAAGLLHVVIRSGDTIAAVLNTAYPGHRVETGGGGLLSTLRYPVSFFLPFGFETAPLANGMQCEVVAMFLDLFPLGILLALWVLFKKRQADPILIALLIPTVIIGAYCFVGFPQWLAQLTLLGMSFTMRAQVVFSLLNLLILFRAAALLEHRPNLRTAALTAAVLALLVIIGCHVAEPQYMGWLKSLCAFVAVVVIMFAFLTRNNRFTAVMCCLAALTCGMLVNPVQRGASPVTDNALIRDIRGIVEDDPHALWLSATDWQANLTTLAGAPTINATNTYPNQELWTVLDPENEQEDVWNRYAHIHATVTSKETSFRLKNIDAIQLDISVEDLERLGVTYVVTNDASSMEALDANGEYTLIDTQYWYAIYRMS